MHLFYGKDHSVVKNLSFMNKENFLQVPSIGFFEPNKIDIILNICIHDSLCGNQTSILK